MDLNPIVNFLGMEIPLHDILKWAHIILAGYWLGGEWGVFNASTNVVNRDLTLEERRRHMTTAVMIDIVPRSCIIWLLPVGFHLANTIGWNEAPEIHGVYWVGFAALRAHEFSESCPDSQIGASELLLLDPPFWLLDC